MWIIKSKTLLSNFHFKDFEFPAANPEKNAKHSRVKLIWKCRKTTNYCLHYDHLELFIMQFMIIW